MFSVGPELHEKIRGKSFEIFKMYPIGIGTISYYINYYYVIK